MILQLSARPRLAVKTLRNNGAKFYDASLAVTWLAENDCENYRTAYVAGKMDSTAPPLLRKFRLDREQHRRVMHGLIVESIVWQVPDEGRNLSRNYWMAPATIEAGQRSISI